MNYTSIEKSKKLAKILPLESADMYYECTKEEPEYKVYVGRNIAITYNLFSYRNGYTIPCWSLAALLDVLPDELEDNHFLTLDKEGAEYCCCYEDGNGSSFRHCFSDNPVDACYELILKLNELKCCDYVG